MFPVDLSLLRDATHMPALPILERSMNRPELRLQDFCIPVNPYFPSDSMVASLQRRIGDVLRYYPGDNRLVASMLGDFVGIDANNIVMANGSTELITWINERLITKSLVTDVPTFGRWTDNARQLGRVVHPFFRDSRRSFSIDVDDLLSFVRQRRARALVVCNPSNPTGAVFHRDELLRLIDGASDLDLIVIDESFVDFVDEHTIPSVAADVVSRENAIVIKSMGKNLGWHGMRCGYAVANPELARRLREMLPPWNLNALAEETIRMTVEAVDDYEAGRRAVVRDTLQFRKRLARLDGVTTFPAHANFIYCRLDSRLCGRELRDRLLLQNGCFVRECGSKIGSTSQYLRIATRPVRQQQLLVDALRESIGQLRQEAIPVSITK